MYCPGCSTPAVEGAKFCKSCGINIGVITQALNGGVPVSDPAREREYKRMRKQISDGIQGSAIGMALIVASGVGLFLLPNNNATYVVSLVLALAGIIKFFRSFGRIIDAKVGSRLADQPPARGTGNLNPSQPLPPSSPTMRVKKPLASGALRSLPQPTSGLKTEQRASRPLGQPEDPPRYGTGYVNREHSSPLRQIDEEDELMLKLRN